MAKKKFDGVEAPMFVVPSNEEIKLQEKQETIDSINPETDVEYFSGEEYEITMQSQMDRHGNVSTWKDYKAPYNKKGSVDRGMLRTATFYAVPIKHIKEAATFLNGRKIDGIYVVDLLARHGFFDGQVRSRNTMAEKLDKPVAAIDLAEERLKQVLRKKDIRLAYANYLSEMDNLIQKEERDDLNQGN